MFYTLSLVPRRGLSLQDFRVTAGNHLIPTVEAYDRTDGGEYLIRERLEQIRRYNVRYGKNRNSMI